MSAKPNSRSEIRLLRIYTVQHKRVTVEPTHGSFSRPFIASDRHHTQK